MTLREAFSNPRRRSYTGAHAVMTAHTSAVLAQVRQNPSMGVGMKCHSLADQLLEIYRWWEKESQSLMVKLMTGQPHSSEYVGDMNWT